MNQNNCPPELFAYCRRELERLVRDLAQVQAHWLSQETLAALGAWIPLEHKIAEIGPALRLIATVYPHRVRLTQRVPKEDKSHGIQKATRVRPHRSRSKR